MKRRVREVPAPGREQDGWIRLPVPLPFALRWVNAYLLPGDDGWTVVDPGLRSPEAEACWEETLRSIGLPWERIGQIVVTHHHPDHYGMAGWLQRRTGAVVRMSVVARRYALRLWGPGETFSEALTAAFAAHGLPPEHQAGVRAHLHRVRDTQVLPHPEQVEWLEPGRKLTMGGTEWELIPGEGHAPGHVSLYDRSRRVMLCGDQVLPDITPNIGWMPDADPDPLGSFLESLDRLAAYDVVMAYPGHRAPFASFGERIGQLKTHHARRLRDMAERVREAGALNAFDCCVRTFGTGIVNDPHHLRFAMAETIAHLVRLERTGTLVRETDGRGHIRFRLAD